ncbi:MAG: HAD family hydrolase [Desulfosarcinaceae bacterium]|jgi:HAD superfamily hydrolase (TIGR01509 family)
MPINHIAVVAFDCDGVMFDSADANIAYYNQILAHLGRPAASAAQAAYCHSHTVSESLAHLLAEVPDLLPEAETYRRRTGYHPFIRHMRMEPHLRPLLTHLRGRCKTAVATNRTDTMQRVLEEHALEGLFDLVVSAADVARPKPHPEQLLTIIAHFGIRPHELCFIGDSDLDQQAADAAGVPFIAFGNPELTAVAHIDRLDRVLDLIDIRGSTGD